MAGPAAYLDRSTGDGAAEGAATPGKSDAERGLETGEPVYVFRLDITDKIRRASRKERHALCWDAIFGAPRAEFRYSFDLQFKAGELKGLGGTLPASETRLTYKLNKSTYTGFDFPAKLRPDEIRGTRDAASALLLETQLIDVLASFSRFGKSENRMRGSIAEAWLGDVLRRLGKDQLPTDYEMFRLLAVSAEIMDKLAQVDEVALNDLIDQSRFGQRDIRQIDYSVKNALRELTLRSWRLDEALRQTRARAAARTKAGQGLRQAIADLRGLGGAYAAYAKLEDLKNPAMGLAELLTNPRIDLSAEVVHYIESDIQGIPQQSLYETELRATLLARLRAAGIDDEDPVAEFERRMDAYRITLRNFVHSHVLGHLGELRTRVQFTINKANADNPGYLRPMFQGLERIEALGRELGSDAVKKDADLLALDRAFPILEFTGFRDEVLKIHRKAQKRGVRPTTVAARHLRSDLIRLWRDRIAGTIRRMTPKDQAWLADTFRNRLLKDLGVPKNSFLHVIAAREQQRVKADEDFWDILLLVLSIALSFVPGAGLIALGARMLALGIDVSQTIEAADDYAEAATLNRLHLSDEEPGPWMFIINVVGSTFSLGDVAKVLRVDTSDLFRYADAVEIDPAIAATVPSRREFYRDILKLKKSEIAEQLAKVRDSFASKISANPFANIPDIAATANLAVRFGITSVDDYINEFIIVIGKLGDAPVDVLRAAHSEAMGRLTRSPPSFSVEALQAAVRDLADGNLPAQIARKREELGRLIREDHELLDQGRRLEATAKQRARRELDKEIGALRQRMAAAREVLLQVRRHRRVLEAQSEAHGRLIAGANARQISDRQIRELGDRTDKAARRLRAFHAEQSSIRAFWDGLTRSDRNVTLGSLTNSKSIIDQQVRAIDLLLQGKPVDLLGRYRLHEAAVAAFLRQGEGVTVGIQVRLRVTLRDGSTVDIIPDCVVRKADGRFHIADAKWSDSEWVESGGTFLGKLERSMTENQALAFPQIHAGEVLDIRFADDVGARQFGLASDAKVPWDDRVDIFINQKGGGLRPTHPRPKE